MNDAAQRNTTLGFALGAAFFIGIIGYLIGHLRAPGAGEIPGALVGVVAGALIGAAMAMGAWRPLPQDTSAATPLEDVPHPNYMMIWGILFVLMMTKVVVAFLAVPKIAIILILVIIAIWKAVLVALYYMHLKFEPRRMWVLAAVPIPLAIILVSAVLYEGW